VVKVGDARVDGAHGCAATRMTTMGRTEEAPGGNCKIWTHSEKERKNGECHHHGAPLGCGKQHTAFGWIQRSRDTSSMKVQYTKFVNLFRSIFPPVSIIPPPIRTPLKIRIPNPSPAQKEDREPQKKRCCRRRDSNPRFPLRPNTLV
jgi:hypothetical protein